MKRMAPVGHANLQKSFKSAGEFTWKLTGVILLFLMLGCEEFFVAPSLAVITVDNQSPLPVASVRLSPGATLDSIGAGYGENQLTGALLVGMRQDLLVLPECYTVEITNSIGGVGTVRPVCVTEKQGAIVNVGSPSGTLRPPLD